MEGKVSLWICPKCHVLFPAGSYYCTKCEGTALEFATIATADQQAAIRRADYDRYRALIDAFIGATCDGPSVERESRVDESTLGGTDACGAAVPATTDRPAR